jgi:hypothetical protein
MRAGAFLVIVMGVVMFSNGTALSGLGIGFGGTARSGGPSAQRASQSAVAQDSGAGIQKITTPLTRRGYPSFTVKAGIPVRWNLYAEKGTINGCNNAIVIPEYRIEKRLQPGDNIIEFTPTKSGRFRYSCWMGMIRGTITVADETAASGIGVSAASAAEAAGLEGSEGTYEDFSAPSCPCCGGYR